MSLYVSLLVQVALLGGVQGSAGDKPDPKILIDSYNSCNKRFQTIYYELETTLLRPDRKYVYSFKHCSNNDKAQWIGGLKCYETDGTINQNISTLFTDIYGDNWGLSLRYNPELHSASPPKALMVHNSREKFLRSLRGRTTSGSPMTGRVDGSNDQSISDLLKGASKMNVQAATKIMGFTTYLVEADTQYGSVKAWISPDAGYNCLKWEVIKRQNQFYRDGKLTGDDFTGWRACFTAHKLDSVDDQYFVTEAEFTEEVKKGETVLSNPTYRYSLTHINLHPDFEAMKAFEIQLPEGTLVINEDVPGIKYRWNGGRIVPLIDDVAIAAIDTAIDDLTLKGEGLVEEQAKKPEGHGGVKQVADANAGHALGQGAIGIASEPKDPSQIWAKCLAVGVVLVGIILAVTFGAYRRGRKVTNNEK